MMTKETIKALRIELARHSGNIPGGSGFLLDEIETLQDANALLDSVYKSACERADQLQSRVQELEKDKARLDWIEENCTYNGGGNGGVYSFRSPMDTEFFREAIDAAMKGTNEH